MHSQRKEIKADHGPERPALGAFHQSTQPELCVGTICTCPPPAPAPPPPSRRPNTQRSPGVWWRLSRGMLLLHETLHLVRATFRGLNECGTMRWHRHRPSGRLLRFRRDLWVPRKGRAGLHPQWRLPERPRHPDVSHHHSVVRVDWDVSQYLYLLHCDFGRGHDEVRCWREVCK